MLRGGGPPPQYAGEDLQLCSRLAYDTHMGRVGTMEVVVARGCALDVHKKTVVAAVHTPETRAVARARGLARVARCH